MPVLCRIVSTHRRNAIVRFFARKCLRFMECYENASNYDFEKNGEQFVLDALSGMSLRCIFDVGANVGDWAVMAAARFPRARIHCFEIGDETAATLRARVQSNPAITVNAFGLSNVEGDVRLKCFPGYSTLTSMVDVSHIFESSEALGRVVRGDDYCSRAALEHVDFVKIDVEGAEWMVLQGLERMIREQRVDIIQFEYGTGSIITKFMLRDYYGFLAPHGYALGKIYPDYVEFRDYDFRHEDFAGPNFLAVRKERDDVIRALG
jgi:FkbM family methyltransferase